MSIDTTTGMSAPPIGRMMRKPRTSASSAIIQNRNWLPCVSTKIRISSASRMARPRLSQCWPLKIKGAPFMIPCSLAKAISEPEKVIAPMPRPKDISTRLCVWIAPRVPMRKASGAFSAAAATNTAARPTSEWKAATSCGNAVIWMRNASIVPAAPPMIRPSAIRPIPPKPMPCCSSVAAPAMPMPIMPKRLPCRDVTGEERPRSASTNRTDATR